MLPVVWQIILQLALIILCAVFSCAEVALSGLNEAKISTLAANNKKLAKRLQRLTKNPSKLLTTMKTITTLAGFLGSAFAAKSFSSLLVALVMPYTTAVPTQILDTLSVIVITLILCFITVLLGDLVPKRIAAKKSDKVALHLSGIIRFFSILFHPLIFLLHITANGILRLCRVDPSNETEEVTEEEILQMVDAGSEYGAIDEEEKDIIQNVFEFDDLSAGEIATHRTDIAALWMDETAEEWERTIHEQRHTIYPVCEDSIDNIIGTLNAKDYFRLDDQSKESILKDALKPPYRVPETVRADVLLRNMRQKRTYFAIVMDEYGGTSGIVTLTDLLQCIVGDIDDGDTPAEVQQTPQIQKVGDATYHIAGLAPIEAVAEALQLDALKECECDTFGGFVMSMLGAIPEDGTVTTTENEWLAVRVTKIKDHRIEMTTVTVKNTDDE